MYHLCAGNERGYVTIDGKGVITLIIGQEVKITAVINWTGNELDVIDPQKDSERVVPEIRTSQQGDDTLRASGSNEWEHEPTLHFDSDYDSDGHWIDSDAKEETYHEYVRRGFNHEEAYSLARRS